MAVLEAISKQMSEGGSGSKIIIYTGVIFILAVFVGLIFVVFNKDYGVLFSDLEANDANSIITELDNRKIKYKIEEGGRKILVEKDKVHEIRLKIVGTVPALTGGVGFEIFDKDDFGTTEFAQKINYQRALQGELARTIMALDEVKFARVHLVLPTSSLFKRQKSESRASITLMLKQNKQLSPQQVAGIQKLVASSTPGLSADKVTILDQKGVTLMDNETDQENILAVSKKLQRKREIEEYLMQKAQAVLDQTFSGNKAYVSIDVALNFNNVKTTRQQVIPSVEKDSNISRKKEVKINGVKKEKSDSTRSTVEVDYALSREIEEIISTPGSISKISVAIVAPHGLEKDQLEYVKTIVANAVGLDGKRGDLIAISEKIDRIKPAIAHTQKQTESTKTQTDMNHLVDTVSQDTEQQRYGNSVLDKISAGMHSMSVFIIKSPLLSFFVLTIVILLLLILSLFFLVKKNTGGDKSDDKKRISDEERQRLLADIKEWMVTSSK